MSQNTLNVRLRNAIKTESEWKSTDPILLKGEVVYSSDKKLYKVGDGTSKWSELSYNLAESLVGLVASVTELNYMDGVTSNVQTQLNNKSDKEHGHSDATTSASGFMSAADKKFVNNLQRVDLGSMSGKTIVTLQSALLEWLNTHHNIANATATFTASPDFIRLWNNNDTTATIPAGSTWTVELKASYYASSNYTLLEITSYYDKKVYYVARSDSKWESIRTVIFADDTITNSTNAVNATKISILENAPSTQTYYYPTMNSAVSGTATVTANANVQYITLAGTTTTDGYNYLSLGNNKNKGTSGNSAGHIKLYSANTGFHDLCGASTTDNIVHVLPAVSGTLLNTGSTSFQQILTSGTAIGTIKINGAETTLYAPENSGNSDTATKVTVSNVTPETETAYYLTFAANTGSQPLALSANGLRLFLKEGTTSLAGYSILRLGNGGDSKTVGNKYGRLDIYSQSTGYGCLLQADLESYVYHTLPAVGGTILNTGNYSSYALPLSGGTSISSGSDLNNYQTVGTYISGSATISASLLNSPVSSAGFRLYVLDGYISGRVVQFITTAGSTFHYRNYNGTSWSNWARFYDMDTLKTSISNNHLPLTGGTLTGDLILHKDSGDSPALIFQRGTLTDSFNDWKIYDTGGTLQFDQRGLDSTEWTNVVKISSSANTVTATGGFVGDLRGNAATATSATFLKVTDRRSGDFAPSNMQPQAISTFFRNTDMPTSAWHSGITVAGWTTDYNAWQLVGDSASGKSTSSLYYRNGASSTWGEWRKILDSGNYSSYALPLSGGTMTGGITMAIDNNSAFNDLGLKFGTAAKIGSTSSAFGIYSNGIIYLRPGNGTLGASYGIRISPTAVVSDGTPDLGTSSNKWLNVYATTFHGALSGNATSATAIKYPDNLDTNEKIDAFLAAKTLQAAIWTSTSSPGVSNGIILSSGYTSTSYGFQLAIDDDPGYYMALRQKGTDGWSSWKRIPMGDGTGASGTWAINISGNATTSTSATSASKLTTNNGSATKGVYFSGGVPVAMTYSLGADVIAYSGSLASGGWKTMGARSSGSKIYVSYNNNPAAWNSATYSSSIVFGVADTKGLLDCSHSAPIVTFGGGSVNGSTDDAPVWYFKLTGTKSITYNLDNYLLKTGDTMTGILTITNGTSYIQSSSGYLLLGYDSSNGSRIGSTENQTIIRSSGKLYHNSNTILDSGNYSSYALPLSGGTLTGQLTINTSITTHDRPTAQCLVINSSAVPSGTTLGLANSPGIGFHIGNYNWGSLIFDGSFKFTNSSFNGYMPVYASTFYGKLSGNASSATMIANYYSSRPTSANVTKTGSGGIIGFKATSSMTTAKPPNDAHVLHFFWDNTGGYDAQLALGTTGNMYYRYCNAGTWQAWSTVLDSNNYSSYALPLSGGTMTGILTMTNGTTYIQSSSGYLLLGYDSSNGSRIGSTENQTIIRSSGKLYHNSNTILDSGNYNSYALPLSGGTLTGRLILTDGVSIVNSGKTLLLGYDTTNGTRVGSIEKQTTIRSNGTLYHNSNTILDSGNYTSYAAPASGSKYYVRVYNSSDVNGSSAFNFNDLAKQDFAMGMIYAATDNPTGASGWCHGISMAWQDNVNTSWISQIALGVANSDGMWYRTKLGTIVGAGWKRVLDSSNYSSYALPITGGTLTGDLTLAAGKHIYMAYNGTNYDVIANYNNKNVTMNACGGGLYLGYTNTTGIYCRGTYVNLDSGNYTSYAAPKDHYHACLVAGGEGSKANTRTNDYSVALITGGWAASDAGYASTYGTTLDVSGYSTWYHRLAFNTTGQIDYYHGINTNSLGHVGTLLTTANYTSYAATAGHNHSIESTSYAQYIDATSGNYDLFGAVQGSYTLKSIRFHNVPAWGAGTYGSAIAFGGADTRGTVSVAYHAPIIAFSGGTTHSGVNWWLKLAGSANVTYNLDNVLPLSGGTMTGSITLNNNVGLYCKNTSGTAQIMAYMGTNNYMYLVTGKSTRTYIGSSSATARMALCSAGRIDICANGQDTNGNSVSLVDSVLRPTTTGVMELGNASYRWRALYSTSSVNVSSDRRLKNTIRDIDDRYMTMCDYLSPKTYYMNDATEKVKQIGFVAQEVEEAAEKAGLNAQDCGFIHKNWIDRPDYQGYEYGLSYDAFGVLAIAKLKQQDEIIKELKAEIEELRSLIT